MWFRVFVLACVLVVRSASAEAQMLGNVNDYPELRISLFYHPQDGSAGEGMSLGWRQNKDVLKVTGSASPPKQSQIDHDLPATVITPIFNDTRNATKAFRFKSTPAKAERQGLFWLTITHSTPTITLSLTVHRGDPEAWAAMMKLWKDLRAMLPPPTRDLIHENL